MSNWFEVWFDSPYYHKLYNNRDEQEAEKFIDNLCNLLTLPEKASVLDLGCGKGRHSKYLCLSGLDATGIDLSPKSIEAASDMENDHLRFKVADMRDPFGEDNYKAVFNLFTSFGYFDELTDNSKVLQNIFNSLTSDGKLVIDFMNAYTVKSELVLTETKNVEGTKFDIKRWCDGKHFYKQIDISDGPYNAQFTERVQYIDFEQFSKLLTLANFKITHSFGDYHLSKFEADTSKRLIIVAEKA